MQSRSPLNQAPCSLFLLSLLQKGQHPLRTRNQEKWRKNQILITKRPHRLHNSHKILKPKTQKKRMRETYNKIVFLLQPVHSSPFLLSNLQTRFCCFWRWHQNSAADLMPILLDIFLVARLPCPQYLTFPLLRILLKAASNWTRKRTNVQVEVMFVLSIWNGTSLTLKTKQKALQWF